MGPIARTAFLLAVGSLGAMGSAALGACGDDDGKADPSTIFSGQGGTTQHGSNASSLCKGYCQALVDNAPGCEEYNANGRCEAICQFYQDSACQTEWEAYASCMTTSQQAECVLPEGAKLTLVISACHSEFDTWKTCRDEKNAGFCPY